MDDLLLSDAFTQLKRPSYPGESPFSFKVGSFKKDRSKVLKLKNYEKNTDFLVEYAYNNSAPTSFGGSEVTDARTDIYALGIVLYHLLVGHPPFRAKTQAAVLSQHLRDKPELIASARPDLKVTDSLERLVMRAMAKAPSDRFASAREMRHVLQGVQKEMGLRVDTTAEMDDRNSATMQSNPRTHGATVTISSRADLAPAPVGSRRWTFALLAVLAIFGYWASVGGEARDSPMGANVTVDVPWERGANRGKPTEARPAARAGATAVTLVSVPSGAKVWNGDKPLGDTPITVYLPAAKTHSLDLMLAGYQTHTAVVDLSLTEPGQPMELTIKLKAMDGDELPELESQPTTRDRANQPAPRARKVNPPRAARKPRPKSGVDPRPKRGPARIEILDAPSRSRRDAPGKRKPKIDLLE